MPRVAQCWQQVHGSAPHEEDVDTLYTAFTPKQITVIADYSTLIPGVKDTVETLCARG
jgi:phosphonoacetaldehyde hydrolase